jgi:hypothetical protein
MDVWNILSTGASTIILLALIHIAVFYVVKTMYPPAPRPQVRFVEPPVVQQQPQPQPEAQPIPPEIPLVTTKLPPPVDTRDPGPARPSQPTFSEAAKEKEVVPPANVPTYESLLSAVSSSKEGFSNLGPMSGATA